MTNEIYTYNPACQPDNWILVIGPENYASAAIDRFNRYIKQIEYRPFDLYASGTLREFAKEIFTERAEIRKIRVCFLLSDWCWTPTSLTRTEAIQEWLDPFWSEKTGHTWLSDSCSKNDATAWVRVPKHLIEELNQLSATVEFVHGRFFTSASPSRKQFTLQITRLGQDCWFGLWDQQRLLYAQPHRIEDVNDLLYTLSILVDKYNVKTQQLALQLAGQWTLDSDFLPPLRQRFSDIQSREANWVDGAGMYPAHWFTPLVDTLACE
jgi:hypothetical protein